MLVNHQAPTRQPHRVQFVWWWHHWWKLWPHAIGPYPITSPHQGVIYHWRVIIGPLEISQWT